ncbi:MAG: hypothetical protein AB2533_11445 [Candidatus Thiodiazotropha endolucinida]
MSQLSAYSARLTLSLKYRNSTTMSDREITLYRGDSVLIPANTAHRVLTTSHQPHCIWLAVHIL